MTTARILEDGTALELFWTNGGRSRFHANWLRDNSPDPDTRSPGNGQRLITILDQPADIGLASAVVDGGRLEVKFLPEAKTVSFSLPWLKAHGYDESPRRRPAWADPVIDRWDGSLQAKIPTASWRVVSRERAALGSWLSAVRKLGFALLTDVPPESGFLCKVAETFGYVRETNYGRWFEVRAEVNPSNLAYTNLGLQAHTDNPYRDPVPTLQLLACLENSVNGGESLVVDGFKVVERLASEEPAHVRLLSSYPARFEYAGTPGVRLRAKRPLIELGPDGELLAVRFNNRSLAAVTDVPFDDMPGYYKACRRFAECIEDPAMAVTFKLAPGELFILDNTRVLHARKAFSGTGKRWLQGCYADKDGLLSTLAAIEEEELTEAAQ
jgi:gamma-butyrobetaine hydroxylase